MTLGDACLLAAEIERDFARMNVIAIGRFVAPDQISDSLPWKVSVMIDGEEKPTIIKSRSQAIDLRYKPFEIEVRTDGMLF
ncbi:MAG: hypothetical protein AAFV88_14125 [Planctomycetota bacterium]